MAIARRFMKESDAIKATQLLDDDIDIIYRKAQKFKHEFNGKPVIMKRPKRNEQVIIMFGKIFDSISVGGEYYIIMHLGRIGPNNKTLHGYYCNENIVHYYGGIVFYVDIALDHANRKKNHICVISLLKNGYNFYKLVQNVFDKELNFKYTSKALYVTYGSSVDSSYELVIPATKSSIYKPPLHNNLDKTKTDDELFKLSEIITVENWLEIFVKMKKSTFNLLKYDPKVFSIDAGLAMRESRTMMTALKIYYESYHKSNVNSDVDPDIDPDVDPDVDSDNKTTSGDECIDIDDIDAAW